MQYLKILTLFAFGAELLHVSTSSEARCCNISPRYYVVVVRGGEKRRSRRSPTHFIASDRRRWRIRVVVDDRRTMRKAPSTSEENTSSCSSNSHAHERNEKTHWFCGNLHGKTLERNVKWAKRSGQAKRTFRHSLRSLRNAILTKDGQKSGTKCTRPERVRNDPPRPS